MERIVSTFYSNHKKIIYIRIKYQVSSTGKENCSTCHFKLLPVMFLFLLLPWDVNVLKKYVCTLKIFPEVSGFHMFLGKQIIHSVGHSWWHLDLLISTFRPYVLYIPELSYVWTYIELKKYFHWLKPSLNLKEHTRTHTYTLFHTHLHTQIHTQRHTNICTL